MPKKKQLKHKLDYRVTTTASASMLQDLLNEDGWQLSDILVTSGNIFTVVQVRFVEVEV